MLLLASACTTVSSPARPDPAPAPGSDAGSDAGSGPASPPAVESPSERTDRVVGPTPTLAPKPDRSAQRPPHPVSLPALARRGFDGGGLRLGEVRYADPAYTQRSVSYRSNGLRISGIVNVPRGRGPFPALVLAHGYIDPAYYATGQGLRREQDWLARAGYVVLHTDYRNHASSSSDPAANRRMRLGYTADVVNAVTALRRTRDVPVDDDRIGLLGRSMGGGVVYNALVTSPGLVDAAVVFAPVSSSAADNFNTWIRDEPGRDELSDFILEEYGEPRENRRFWSQVSPRTYVEEITEPVLIHHGTSDDTCPIRWSRETAGLMERAGVDVELLTYEGEGHAFGPAWPGSMRRTVAFFERHL